MENNVHTGAAVAFEEGDLPGFDYIISGLTVRSAIELPSAIRLPERHPRPDVSIGFGAVAAELPFAEDNGSDWSRAGETFLLHFPGVLRALIQGGRSMRIQVEPGHDPADLVLYLLGTCFAVILQQRGRVVLHASAVAVRGRAMLFCGQSGAGKSTIAALLERRGYPLLNDDVCNVSVQGGNYVVYPDGRMLKLWAESMAHLQKPGSAEARVRRDLDKFYAAPERIDFTPRPVGGVYILHAREDSGKATLARLNTAESLSALTQNAYRPTLVRAMKMTPAYFDVSVAIQRSAGVYRLSRPMDFARAEEALDLLEQHWQDGSGEV